MLTEQLLKVAAVGGEWILWLLLIMSFVSTGGIVDRWWFFRRRQLDVRTFGAELIAYLERGDRAGAQAMLRAHKSVEAAVVLQCMDWLDDGPEAVGEVLQAALREHRPLLEKKTVMLGTVGNNAPFVGLLGTVLGIVKAFRELGQDAMGAMGSVMAGIGEALVATAVGILVAIPAVVAFNVFTTRAAEVEERAQALMNLVLAHMKSTRAERPLAGPARIEPVQDRAVGT